MVRILFFTTAIEHTTFRKTAQMLSKEGAKVHIIGFTRNNFPSGELNGITIESLGEINHGNYLSRLFKLFKFLFILRKRSKEFDVIYNFTLDTLIISKIALVFAKKKWVYQIQDIRSIFLGKKIINRLARLIEGVMLKKINLLVLSSIDYYFDFYKVNFNYNKNNVLIIENKLDKNLIKKNESIPFVKREKILGYFGVMRCSMTLRFFKFYFSNFSDNIFLKMRGKPTVELEVFNELIKYDNVNYGGQYKSPEELSIIYSDVDLVWASYPFHNSDEFGNWKMARTIRFYEACAFGIPVIVQKGTPQAADVIRYDIGLVVDVSDFLATKELLDSVTNNDLKRWKQNILKLDPSFYFYTNEYLELYNRISTFL